MHTAIGDEASRSDALCYGYRLCRPMSAPCFFAKGNSPDSQVIP